MNYLGIGAGAFLDRDGRGYYRSFDLASGVRFGFYAAETRGIRKAAVAIAGVNAASVEHSCRSACRARAVVVISLRMISLGLFRWENERSTRPRDAA
jgi:hypothetical protein